jgi:hypothetical protein
MSLPETHPLAPRPAGWYPDPAGTGGQRWHDGQGWTAQVSHGAPQQTPLGPGFARLSDWLGRMLVACGVVYLLGGACLVLVAMNPPDLDLQGNLTTTSGSDPAGGAGTFGVLLYLGFGAFYLATNVTWLVWQYQLAASAPVRLRRSPAGHVGWWFVPFASWVIPRSCIGELWHAYGTTGRGEPAEPTPGVFSLWWALWLSPLLLAPMVFLVVFRSGTPDGAVQGIFVVLALDLLARGAAGLAACSVVRDLSWRALVYWSQAAQS